MNLAATYNVFGNINKTTCTLYVPANSVNDYKASLRWKDFVNIVGLTTGVPTLPTASITLYPNPVTDAFQITGFEGLIDVSISDLQGRVLRNNQIRQNEFVSLKTFAKGIYIVKLNSGNSTYERKIVRE